MIIWTKIGSTFALAMTGSVVLGDIAQSTLNPQTQLPIGWVATIVAGFGSRNLGMGDFSGVGYGTDTNEHSIYDSYMGFIGSGASRDASVPNSYSLSNSMAIGRNAKVATNSVIALGGTGVNAVRVGINTGNPGLIDANPTFLFEVCAPDTSSKFYVSAGGAVGFPGNMFGGYNVNAGNNFNGVEANLSGTAVASTVNTTTPGFKSLGTNGVVLTCPDGGSFILRVDNAGTLTTVTNSGGL